MAITGVPPSSVDPVAQVVAALEAATATLAAAALTLADRGSWLTATSYAVGDVSTQAGQRYLCRTAHTSGTFATDLAASKWVSLDAVAALATSSNLSDVVSASSARTNLGLAAVAASGSASDLSAGSIPAGRFGNTTIPIAAISVSGTASSSTFLRGDGAWQTTPGAVSSRGVWASGTNYAVGDLSVRGSWLQQCATAHTAALPFDTTKWVRLGSTLPLDALQGVFYSAFGHSIANGSTAENSWGWNKRLYTHIQGSQYNANTASGQEAQDTAKSLLTWGVNPPSAPLGLFTWESATNDMTGGSSAQAITGFTNGLQAFLWFARTYGYSGSWVDDTSGTYTGTWVTNIDNTNCRSSTAHSTTTQNDKVDFTITPNANGQAVVFLKGTDDAQFGTVGATYSVKQGSTVLATGSLSNASKKGGLNVLTTGHVPVPLSGLGATSTTITVTKTDANGTILIIDGVAIPSTTPATVLVIKDPTAGTATDPVRDAYWTAIDSAVTSIGAGAGEIVVANPTNWYGSWDKNVLTTDGTHPGDQGHWILYQAAAEALYAAVTFRKGQNSAP